jgi:hypothetical protein
MKARIALLTQVLLALLPASLLLGAFASEAHADTFTIWDSCGSFINPRLTDRVPSCKDVLGGTLGELGGSGFADAKSFLLKLFPVSFSFSPIPGVKSDSEAFNAELIAGPTNVDWTYLELEGKVTLNNSTSTVTLTLKGSDNAGTNDILTRTFEVGTGPPPINIIYMNCRSYPCTYNMGEIFQLFQTAEKGITNWDESVNVKITDGGAYTNAGYTPDRFGGASGPVVTTPEPTELIPLMLGLSLLTGLGRNRRKRITPPPRRS